MSLRNPAVVFAISVFAILASDVWGIFEKGAELFGNAEKGVFSDVLRFLCYYAAGLLAFWVGVSSLRLAAWVLLLVVIDRTFVVLRVLFLSGDPSSINLLNLLLGATAILVVTMLLALPLAFAGYYTGTIFSNSKDTSSLSARLGSLLLICALAALVLPYVYGANTYMLLVIHDFPIFYLTFSYGSVVILFCLLALSAATALASWTFISLVHKTFISVPKVVLGGLLLSGAFMTNWALVVS